MDNENLDSSTMIKVRKSTTNLLKQIAKQRGRRETQEQVILELIDRYIKMEVQLRG